MKAFLLAAGLGTRLHPLTNTLPKCLLPIGGKPLLAYWFELFRQHGIRDVLINTHHLAPLVEDYLARTAPEWRVRIEAHYEPELLGSAGTVRLHRRWVENEDAFLICYADNLTDADLSELVAEHRRHSPILTMGLFKSPNPAACGIALLNERGGVVEFEEKPAHPKSDTANAGVYVASPSLLDYISETEADFGKEILPKLIHPTDSGRRGQMRGVLLNGYLRDIGTLESYAQAQLEWFLRTNCAFQRAVNHPTAVV